MILQISPIYYIIVRCRITSESLQENGMKYNYFGKYKGPNHEHL